jgi:hydrogenase expression/formation protein
MADVTNGGLRADLHEIGTEAGCGALVNEDEISSLVNREVMILLEESGVDYLGVSLDSLLIFCDEDGSTGIMDDLEGVGVRSRVIGHTTEDSSIRIQRPEGLSEFLPRFRESAYTKVKSVVDSGLPVDIAEMEANLQEATDEALRRKKEAIELIRGG